MQAFFLTSQYIDSMAITVKGSHLRKLREAAGLSLREVARQIGEQPSNLNYWETSGQLPRSNVLIPIAKVLGVTVEELLGESRPKRILTPGGKVRKVFEAVTRLPRRQQEKIIEVIEALVERQNNGHKKAA